jgi:hypothetical protein
MPDRTARFPKTAALAGVGLGVVIAIVALRFAPRGPGAPRASDAGAITSPGSNLPEDEGPLGEVLFHYVPSQEAVVADAYRDFLSAIDPRTRLVAVVPTGGSAALDAFLGRIDASLAPRTRVVEVEAPITVWSKDRALVLAPRAGVPGAKTTLVIPVPPDPKWKERTHDWATLAAVASAMSDRFLVREIPLAFDAGDFAVTRDRVIVDVNLFEKNQGRGLDTPAKLQAFVRQLFARDVVLLGERPGDVPRHHLSMYMTPLGDGVILVGDPRAAIPVVGRDFAPGEVSPDTAEPLRADFGDATLTRFDRAAADLAAAGYRIERVPVVPFDDKTYITYTNGVYETREGRIAYVPQYGIAGLDALGRAAYERLGWTVRPVRVREAYPYHGTIGCLTNVLAR